MVLECEMYTNTSKHVESSKHVVFVFRPEFARVDFPLVEEDSLRVKSCGSQQISFLSLSLVKESEERDGRTGHYE